MSTGSTNKNFPVSVDTFATWQDDVDLISSSIVNDIQGQIVVIEENLGTGSGSNGLKGSLADLKTRLAVSINNDGTLKTSAIGATGVAGVNGATGVQGTQGDVGAQGATGVQGLTGVQGIQGNTGLIGQTGVQGQQGQTGVQGTQGVQGNTGLIGSTGTQGIQGTQGNTGLIGQTGTAGTTGLVGQTGVPGNTGLIGATGVQGISGGAELYTGIQKQTVTVNTSAGTKAVTFATAYADTSYQVCLTPLSANCWATVTGSKTAAGFTIALLTGGTSGSAPFNADASAGGVNVDVDVIAIHA